MDFLFFVIFPCCMWFLAKLWITWILSLQKSFLTYEVISNNKWGYALHLKIKLVCTYYSFQYAGYNFFTLLSFSWWFDSLEAVPLELKCLGNWSYWNYVNNSGVIIGFLGIIYPRRSLHCVLYGWKRKDAQL